MGCAPVTCCEIPCGCCALGFGWPLYHCICPSDPVSGPDGSRTMIKPPFSTPEAFNTDFYRLRQNTIDNKHFRRTVDSWKPQSLSDLISSLHTYCAVQNTIEKIWIVFYWITQNISYDADSYLNGRIPSQTPSEVFQKRKGVCAGYASLFLHLCTTISVKCVKISGYAKGYSYEIRGDKVGDANHAWNGVNIGSFWYLIDSTWGAGSLDEKVFKKKLDLHYYLTRPEQLIYTHLPQDRNWQLLSHPMTMKKFLSLPKTSPPFFELDLKLLDKNTTHIVHLKPNQSYAEIPIRCPPDTVLHISMQQNGKEVDGNHLIQYNRENGSSECCFAPQQNGWHKLLIYGKKKGTPGSLDCVVQFSLNVPRRLKSIMFPKTYGLFIEKKCYLYEPLSYVLQKGSEITIHCRILDVKRVAVVLDGNKWVYDDKYKGEIMKLTVIVPEKSITINAELVHGKSIWSTLVEYTVN